MEDKRVKKVLLMNMPSTIKVYGKSALKGIIAPRPFVSMAELAASILAASADCKILDLQISEKPYQEIVETIDNYKPDFIGITFTTLLFEEAEKISKFIKEKYPKITIIAGGVHSSIYPEEVAKSPFIDIVVYGEGDVTLQEIAKGSDNIEFLGRVSDKEKAELYSGCLAFLNPQEEDFGITAVESMASGRPVIAYEKGGALETVINGKTGIFFKKQTPEDILDAVNRFFNIDFNSKEIRIHAENFSVENFKKKISDFIKKELENFKK